MDGGCAGSHDCETTLARRAGAKARGTCHAATFGGVVTCGSTTVERTQAARRGTMRCGMTVEAYVGVVMTVGCHGWGPGGRRTRFGANICACLGHVRSGSCRGMKLLLGYAARRRTGSGRPFQYEPAHSGPPPTGANTSAGCFGSDRT